MLRSRMLLAIAAVVVVIVPRTAAAAFEDVEVSPRWRAIGSAGAAAPGDPYAVLRNPSSLAWTDGVAGAFSYLQPFSLAAATQNVAAAAVRLPGGAGALGVGVRSFGVRHLGVTLEEELTVSVGHGFRLMHDAQSELAFGWSVDFYHLSFGSSVTGLDPGSAATAGLSVGASAVVRDRTRLGFAIRNFNSPSIGDRDREPLPRRMSGGMVYEPYAGMTAMVDLASTVGEAVEYRGGIEIEPADFLRLRAGIGTEPNTFSAGLGVRVRGVVFDYGFSSGGGTLAETHHVGIEVHGPALWKSRP